jgi:hypothetical protein
MASTCGLVRLCATGDITADMSGSVGFCPRSRHRWAAIRCAKAPTFCVIAPPQKKLRGATVILLLSLYGAGFVPRRVDNGA